jgi:hypothetical protein
MRYGDMLYNEAVYSSSNASKAKLLERAFEKYNSITQYNKTDIVAYKKVALVLIALIPMENKFR